VLQYYLANGFDQVKVEIRQKKETADGDKTDVSLNVTEGQQVFVNRVLLSGVEKTRPSVVDQQILVHAGDPLDQTALLQTQRNLYNIALFNEVVAAVQNPAGDAPQKNVVLQVTEAKRWNVTYGFGFEAQTGTPQAGTISEASCIQLGLTYPCNQLSPEGKPGVSPRVSLDVSRINLRGSEDSLTLHTSYGLLEQVATLTLQNPHLRGSKNFSAAISGGYSNVQDITTFQASTLQGDFRITEKFRRTHTFIYDFLYRRVKVNPNSLQVSADLIPLLSQPVRVGGPSLRGRRGHWMRLKGSIRRYRRLLPLRSSARRLTSGSWMEQTRLTTSLASKSMCSLVRHGLGTSGRREPIRMWAIVHAREFC